MAKHVERDPRLRDQLKGVIRMAGNRTPKASSTRASKDTKIVDKPTPRTGPQPNTKAWFENVQAGARGLPMPHVDTVADAVKDARK